MSDIDAEGIAAFAFELGVLKRVRRAGWWHAGVQNPESVAEHTMRAAQLAAIIAAEEGADPARAAMLALWHDTQETRTGDLPHSVQGYLPKPDARQITADQTATVPDASRTMIGEAVDEFETGETSEAICARDADRLEMLFQAIEYRDIGVQRVDGWIESARKGIKTEAGRRIAEAAVTVSPLAWRNR
jgi:putative hydrolase of HD superfamily